MNTHSFRITGLMAAPFAPMEAGGSIAPDRVPAYAARLKADGVRGVFVNGTTGEGQSLDDGERRLLAEAWIREQADGFPVVVHVGHTCLAVAQALAEHAQRQGAAAIAAIAPYFFRPGLDGLLAWLAAIAEAAPCLPLYHYHMPAMSGSAVRMADLFAAAGRIPTLAGVKYTHEDLHDFRRTACLADGRYDCVFGRDEILLAGLAMGARGAVGSTYNYAAPLYLRVIGSFARGDLVAARHWQDQAQELVDLLVASGGGVAGGKAFMAACGIDLGPCRAPLARPVLSESIVARVRALITGGASCARA